MLKQRNHQTELSPPHPKTANNKVLSVFPTQRPTIKQKKDLSIVNEWMYFRCIWDGNSAEQPTPLVNDEQRLVTVDFSGDAITLLKNIFRVTL